MAWMKRYPVISIALLLITCVHFEVKTSSPSVISTVELPGLAAGLFVLCIIGVVLCYKIFNSVELFCRTKGWLNEPPKRRYDILLAFGIPAAMLKIENRGSAEGIDPDFGEVVYEWIFRWGDKDWDVEFILALCAVVLLLRILELVRSLELCARARPIDSE